MNRHPPTPHEIEKSPIYDTFGYFLRETSNIYYQNSGHRKGEKIWKNIQHLAESFNIRSTIAFLTTTKQTKLIECL